MLQLMDWPEFSFKLLYRKREPKQSLAFSLSQVDIVENSGMSRGLNLQNKGMEKRKLHRKERATQRNYTG